MKKTVTRILSMTLAVVLLTCSLTLGVCAEEGTSIPQYSNYTVLGDSNASGYGLEVYFENAGSRYTVKEGDLIEGSYPAILAEAVGAENVSVRSHSGWRTNEMLRMLGYSDNYESDPNAAFYDRDYFYTALGFASYESLEGESERVQSAIQNADLITLNLGSNDIFSYGLFTTISKYSYILGDVSVQPQSIEEMVDVLNAILSRATEIELKGMITELVCACETGLASYQNNFPILLNAIKELNPSADIVVVSMMNPVAIYLDFTEDLSVPLYQLPDLTVFRANEFARSVCKEYDVMYADVSGARSFGVEAVDTELLAELNPDVVFSMLKMLHPTEASHQYMASQILEVLKANAVTPQLSGSYSKVLKRNTLTWTAVDGAYRYRIYRSTSQDGDYAYIGMSTNETYYDHITLKGTTYYYKVKALMDFTGSVTSPYSNIISLTAK